MPKDTLARRAARAVDLQIRAALDVRAVEAQLRAERAARARVLLRAPLAEVAGLRPAYARLYADSPVALLPDGAFRPLDAVRVGMLWELAEDPSLVTRPRTSLAADVAQVQRAGNDPYRPYFLAMGHPAATIAFTDLLLVRVAGDAGLLQLHERYQSPVWHSRIAYLLRALFAA